MEQQLQNGDGQIARLEARVAQFQAELAEARARGQIAQPPASNGPLKLDLGCGIFKKPGYVGVDSRKFDGVDVVTDLCERWPWADESVDEVYSSQLLEHLTPLQRIHFVNELYRVLKHGAKAMIITPHWCSNRAYGDLTHQWPPVSEMFYAYLNANWRKQNAPHNDQYTCDFDFPPVLAHNVHPNLNGRNQEFVNDKLAWSKEAASDLMATVYKK